MLSPTPRLLWLLFLLMVPALAWAGIDLSLAVFVAPFLLFLLAALTFDAWQLNKTLPRTSITAMTPVSAYKDRPALLNTMVVLPSSLSEVDIALDLPPSFSQADPIAHATSSGTISFPLTPQERGEFAIARVFISADSGWNLWRLRMHKPVTLLVKVFPNLSQDPASRKLFFSMQQGQRLQRLIGRGREVERLREYAVGDSFDEIYWKATARRGFPVSKVFQVERTQDIYAIVDGSRLGHRNQALERFVSASLLLAVVAEKNNDNFGLLMFRDKVEDFVRASRGKGHFHRCREAIYDCQPATVSPDFAELFTFISLRIRKRALLFFLTDLSDPLLAENFIRDAPTITRRHIVMLNQIADAGDRPLFSGALPENDRHVETRLAGHLQWAKLRELEKALGHVGVHMQLLRSEQTSADLIGQYLNVKQRQLL